LDCIYDNCDAEFEACTGFSAGSSTTPGGPPTREAQPACNPDLTEQRRVFVTSTRQTAALGGIAGADAICATQAADANLEGEFEAWLSTISSSVVARLSHDGGPFVQVDGLQEYHFLANPEARPHC
jgi:hypothetical protein